MTVRALTFDVIGTLIDFERRRGRDGWGATPSSAITEPDLHVGSLRELADAVDRMPEIIR